MFFLVNFSCLVSLFFPVFRLHKSFFPRTLVQCYSPLLYRTTIQACKFRTTEFRFLINYTDCGADPLIRSAPVRFPGSQKKGGSRCRRRTQRARSPRSAASAGQKPRLWSRDERKQLSGMSGGSAAAWTCQSRLSKNEVRFGHGTAAWERSVVRCGGSGQSDDRKVFDLQG